MDEREFVRVSVEEPHATITVDRPEKRNAMDIPTRRELRDAVDQIRAVDGVRVVVLRGAGEGSFIAGGDLESFDRMDMLDGQSYLAEHAGGLYDAVADLPMPVVAAIDGPALGGGLEIALACDLRLASADAVFGLPEVGLGVIPAAGGTRRLPAIVGVGRAKDLIMTGRIIDAREALEMGLVTRVVEPAEFEDAVTETIEGLAAKAPLALKYAKEAIDLTHESPQTAAIERLAGTVLWGTADKEEGVRAFLEDREPSFEGR